MVTKMVTNTGPRAAIERHGMARAADFPNTNQHLSGVRHAKLMIACGCKSHPVKAVAGRSELSLAGVVVTRGLKCRQEPCGAWD